jgi:hypothetical protein
MARPIHDTRRKSKLDVVRGARAKQGEPYLKYGECRFLRRDNGMRRVCAPLLHDRGMVGTKALISPHHHLPRGL